eukprot:CAMPEP_0174907750 /NCGR_PEP_ID=MMETSP0167-20121228/61956_1 /TAXON_ID=38298 /ORGANISM="Rhodella maculata, Strain CCMP736" /LENGTH=63 /DNA_ID=CAMNT_0016151307 /DNA_START=235 /DNA_END=423 /DNA_ORIENTATION=+
MIRMVSQKALPPRQIRRRDSATLIRQPTRHHHASSRNKTNRAISSNPASAYLSANSSRMGAHD